jgi:hypothetical protein
MNYIPTILILLAFVAAFQFSARISKARPSDFEAIHELANARALRIISIEQRYNQWPYWLRGQLFLSNIARIFVVTVESKDGRSRELHVAIDNNWGAPDGIQVLHEIAIGSYPVKLNGE